ncbi:MAG: TniB family NTP-binding protein [Anaerolineae bacterium]|nr:TniB family NTP-binding protein [Anaerolineae bacterium]
MTYPTPAKVTVAEEHLAAPVDRANAVLIRYPRFNRLLSHIQLCREMSRTAGEPQCIILEGVPGTGKSTLVQSYAASCARYETPSGTKVPVFYAETPAPVTVKGMAARLLQVLGDPAAHHGTLWSMNARLVHLLQTCEVQLIILDDFHHLIDQETNRVLGQVADWLKVLIKETNIPFLVVGVEGTVSRILDANAQLSRLFAIRETLQPFQWDSRNPETIKEFMTFVAFAERLIGLRLTAEIAREDLLYRIYAATDGVVGNVMNLLRYAVALAQQRAEDILSLEVLTQAFDLRLAAHVRKKSPFRPADNLASLRSAPPAASAGACAAENLSAAAVLTTK